MQLPFKAASDLKSPQAILILGDALIFVFFAAEGRATHDISLGQSPALTVLTVAAPFAVPWFIMAGLLGVFRTNTIVALARMLFWTTIAWLSSGCIGLVARAIILQRPLAPAFAVVALGINAALLLGWHLLVSLSVTARRKRNPRVIVFQDAQEMSRAAAEQFARLAAEAVAARGRFCVALSGGETPQMMYRLLAQPPYPSQVPWVQTRVYWGDERCVPPDDPGSNYYEARLALLDHVPIPPENVHRIKGELDPQAAAMDYATQLRQAVAPGDAGEWPRFDLALLGLGADGHTASLFPGLLDPATIPVPVSTAAGQYQNRPVQRVTLTPRVLNDARNIIFLVTGENKAIALAETIEGIHNAARWPAQSIHPAHGQVTWIVDRAAASHLKA